MITDSVVFRNFTIGLSVWILQKCTEWGMRMSNLHELILYIDKV